MWPFLLLAAQAANGDLNPLIAHYKAYKSITFTIVHHGDVGAPGKDNADRIYWTAGRFEINPIPFGGNEVSTMPKLVCNDGQVTTFLANGELGTSKQDPGPDAIGAWESRGGLLLDWLMDGKLWKQMVEPQNGVAVNFTTGPETTWHDKPARQVTLEHDTGTYHDKFLIFVSPKGDELLGTQYEVAGKTIWSEFRDEDAKS